MVRIIFLNKYRDILLMSLYPLMFFMFWIFTKMRIGKAQEDSEEYEKIKCTLSSTIFYLSGMLSALLTFTMLQQEKRQPKTDRQDLGNFILKSCEHHRYEDIEKSLNKFCFDCMVVHTGIKNKQICHCI